MDIPGSKRRICDEFSNHSLNDEMKVTKSGPNIKLREYEQQLELAETTCGSLKSQLDYMKLLCQVETDMQQTQDETNISEKANDISQEEELSHKKSTTKYQATDLQHFSEEHFDSDNINNYDFHEDLQKIQQMTNNNEIETKKYESCKNPKIPNASSKITIYPNIEKIYEGFILEREEREEKDVEEKAQQSKKMENRCIDPDSILLYSPLNKTKEMYQENDTTKDVTKKSKGCVNEKQWAEYVAQVQHGALSFRESFEQSMNDRPDWNFQALPSVRTESHFKTHGFIVNNSGSMKSARLPKTKNLLKEGKKQPLYYALSTNKKTSACKVDQTITTKVKRKKGKLRNISSKSTITAKEMNVTVRRDIKKRNQKDYETLQPLCQPDATLPKLQHNWSGIVELYHNTAIKHDSISAISSKHSKFESRIKDVKKQVNMHNEPQNIHTRLPGEHSQCQHVQQTSHARQENTDTKFFQQIEDQHKQIENIDKLSNCDHTTEKHEPNKQQNMFGGPYYYPMAYHNYEMPTLSSKLKRTNRSYFNRFNFRNIPFIVGTSITPSHNLGLNIQQVLSIMKARQPSVSGVTPLLIRKVSKGLESVSTLVQKISDRKEESLDEPNSSIRTNSALLKRCSYTSEVLPKLRKQSLTIGSQQVSKLVVPNEPEKLNLPNDTYKKEAIQVEVPLCRNQQQSPKNLVSLKAESTNDGNLVDMELNEHLQGSKGIREVLINLHDQFEEMNIKYEQLQAKLEKSNDQSLVKEINTLEKELNAKEEEINAVVGLYKEVMALKQQMKLMQEKNSFVCIATEVPGIDRAYSPAMIPSRIHRTCTRNSMQTFNLKRRNTISTLKEPASIKLAGLLRQIQMFQKQLKLAS